MKQSKTYDSKSQINLKKDLEEKIGVKIIDFEIGNINFLRDTAEITIKYKV